LLVPFAAATDDHQTKNAEAMVRVGAGRVLPETELSPEHLCAALVELTADRARLLEMARAARAARNIDAAARLADLCVTAGGSAA
jgi:UDP-N-acetylglucosamine--N-acetylmuramyl-(pentapeptide) pyrophosphoryl-undecaprenol N-acetylglucosamine transferase